MLSQRVGNHNTIKFKSTFKSYNEVVQVFVLVGDLGKDEVAVEKMQWQQSCLSPKCKRSRFKKIDPNVGR
jgi:hypothetical protein